MFKDLLKQWVTEIYQSFESGVNGTNSTILSDPLGSWSPTLYGYIIKIMENVVMPVALVMLSLFFVLALYRTTLKVDGSGAGSTFSVQVVFKTLIKLALCVIVVEMSLDIMQAIFGVSTHLMSGISREVKVAAISGETYQNIIQNINGMNTGEQIGYLLMLAIIKFGIWIMFGIVNIIIVIRFLEIYIRIAFSPIALATLAEEETSSIGKNYFKSFAAVCLHGVFILLILTFFPILLGAEVIRVNGLLGSVYVLPLYTLLLLIGVLSSNRLAKSICNAT